MGHPVATPIQHEHERLALELTKHPIVKAAFERVRTNWLAKAAPSPDMMGCFEQAFEEVMFAASVWSLNQDSLRPRVISITRLEHRLGDLRIPGSRWGIDNPDTVYRVIRSQGMSATESRAGSASRVFPRITSRSGTRASTRWTC